MKFKILVILLLISSVVVNSQITTLSSPDQKITVSLFNTGNTNVGEWYLKVSYSDNGKITEAIPRINIGLVREDQDFSKALKFIKAGKPVLITEQYSSLIGKKKQRNNSANESVISFENPDKTKLNLIIRAYNDGMVFRYEFPD